MKVNTGLPARELKEVPAQAQRAEALGFDGISFGEVTNDAFLLSALALEHTQRVVVSTSVALAFPRSPMTTAHTAWDLQRLSDGRFELGLGSQTKSQNERLFSLQWSPPAPRMREYAQALRAIWDCWQNGTPLNYHGQHYNFTLMTAALNPGPIDHPRIPILAAALGPAMCRVAGEVFDGISLHPLTTPRFTREVILPMAERGAQRSGRSVKDDLTLAGGGFVATGATEAEVHNVREAARRRISLYGSMRAYKVVWDLHEWGDTCLKLHDMSLKGQWSQMPAQITDTMLDTFCVSGTYGKIAPKLKERYGHYASRVSVGMPSESRYDDQVGALVEELHRYG